MNKRTLEALVVYTFILGGSTSCLVWTALNHFLSDAGIWIPISNALIGAISLWGVVKCFRKHSEVTGKSAESQA